MGIHFFFYFVKHGKQISMRVFLVVSKGLSSKRNTETFLTDFFAVFCLTFETYKKTISSATIQGDSVVFSINQNLNSLHQVEHRFSRAFYTKVLHFRDNRKNVQF